METNIEVMVDCIACGGTGWASTGWLPSGGCCGKCRGNGYKLVKETGVNS